MWKDPVSEPATRSSILASRERDSATRPRRRSWTAGGSSPTSSPRRPTCTPASAGVVPEIASRRHLELVVPVDEEALGEHTLDDVDAVAVTQGPGLIGALLVGLSAAKALAWGRGLPLVPVNHLHGHVASLYLEPEPLEPPFLCLLASGGHTLLVDVPRARRASAPLGTTLDDAAGEAFDKGARLLGLGYPGGAEIDRLAREGDPEAFDVPGRARARARLLVLGREDGAALRGARARATRSRSGGQISPRATSGRSCARSSGGRSRPPSRPGPSGSPSSAAWPRTPSFARALPEATAPPLALCTDNAAMIASAARYVEAIPPPGYLALDAYASAL